MFKLLTKLGLSFSSVIGTFFLGQPLLVKNQLKEVKSQENKTKLNSIEKFEDIEIYAKEKGCSFLFVGAWKSKKVYNAETFLEKHKKDDWKEKMLKGAKNNQISCKEGKSLVFVNYGNSLVIKQNDD